MIPLFLNRLRRLSAACPTRHRKSQTSARRQRAFHRESARLEPRALLTVTTTYGIDLVQNIDLTQGPTTSQPDATSLANGGIAVSGTHLGHTDVDIFSGSLSDVGGASDLPGTNSAIDQLSNGNLVVVSQDADSIRYSILNSTGGIVVASTDIGDTNSSEPDVAALYGGFWIVNQDYFSGTDYDIDVNIYTNSGSLAGSFTIDSSGAQDTRPRIAAVDNFRAAIAWTRTVGGETEVWMAVYDVFGQVVSAPAVFDSGGIVNRNVDITSTADGFAIVYEDSGWGTGEHDITLARFNSSGATLGFTNISNPTFDTDFLFDRVATVTRLENNLLVVGWVNTGFGGDSDSIIALVDPATGTRLGTRNITAGESIGDDVGRITVAGSANGQIQVFQSNFTDGDVDGETLVGRRSSFSEGHPDTITGDAFIDIMHGNGGSDTLLGGGNNDTLNGGDQNDTLNGGPGNDTLNGGDHDDTLIGGTGADTLEGGPGIDTASYAASPAAVTVNLTTGIGSGGDAAGDALILLTIERVIGSAFNDTLTGDTSNNTLIGGNGGDTLYGAGGIDTLYGQNGADFLNGQAGRDILTGGANNDRFIFTSVTHSPPGANRDRITDFVKAQLDKISVATIDGKAGTAGVNPFTQFRGTGAFTAEGQIRAVQSGANTIVQFNTTGTSGAEMEILLVNFTANTLALSDFIVAAGFAPFASSGTGSGATPSAAKQTSVLTTPSSVTTASPVLSQAEITERADRVRSASPVPVAKTTGAVSQKKSSPTRQTEALSSTGGSSAQLKALDSIFTEISSELLALA